MTGTSPGAAESGSGAATGDSTGDSMGVSTRPGDAYAAPAVQRVRAQAWFEVGNQLRNGEQLLVSIVLPAIALIGLALTTVPSLGTGRRIDLAVPGIMALGVISAAFTSQAIATAFDRRYAVLRYLGVTPLGRGGLLSGKVLATLAVELVQLVVLGGLGLTLGWRPQPSGLAWALLFLVMGTWSFVALALLLAGTLRAEAVLAVANLLWVLFLVLGVVQPRTQLPAAASGVAAWLPSAALADGLRTALADGALNAAALLVVSAWAVLATALAVRFFRFDD